MEKKGRRCSFPAEAAQVAEVAVGKETVVDADSLQKRRRRKRWWWGKSHRSLFPAEAAQVAEVVVSPERGGEVKDEEEEKRGIGMQEEKLRMRKRREEG